MGTPEAQPVTALTLTPTKKRLRSPKFIIISGRPGTGKTTLASFANKPFFVATEKGCESLPDDRAGRFSHINKLGKEELTIATHIDHVYQMLKWIIARSDPADNQSKPNYMVNDIKTVVIDGGKSLNVLIADKYAHLKPEVKQNGMQSFNETNPYYQAIESEWIKIYAYVEVFKARGIETILLCHSQEKNEKIAGTNESYKRMEIDLPKYGQINVGEYLASRADCVIYVEASAQITKINVGSENKPRMKAVAIVDKNEGDELSDLNTPEIIAYMRATNRAFAKTYATDHNQVKDFYKIDMNDENTSKIIFADLNK